MSPYEFSLLTLAAATRLALVCVSYWQTE